MMVRTIPTLLYLLCLMPPAVQAQTGDLPRTDVGVPFYLQHYPAHIYRAHPQNWASVQDQDGIMYAANYDGILIYDGSTWELVPTPSNTTARSLDVGLGNTVFVGLQGDLGYLKDDSLGRTTFVSLRSELPEDERDFWDVWGTHGTESSVYFQTKSRLYRWDGSSFQIWRSERGYHTSFKVGNQLYVREKGVGLLRVEDGRFRLIPHGDRFADLQVFVVGELTDGNLLIGTQKEGLYVLSGSSLERFPTQADDYILKHRLYHGKTLPGGYAALALLDGGGLVLINGKGEVVSHLTEGDGLPDGWINHVQLDAQGGLWLSLNNRGLVRLDPISPLTRFTSDNGIEGSIADVERLDGSVYVATSTGLFLMRHPEDPFHAARFERVTGVSVAKRLLNVGDELLVAGHGGLYRVRDGEVAEEIADGTFFSGDASMNHPGRYYFGSKAGVSILQRDGDSWSFKRDIVRIGEEVYAIAEDSDGRIWMTTRSSKVYSTSRADTESPVLEYRVDDEITNSSLTLTRVDGEVVVLGSTGMYSADSASADLRLNFVPFEREGESGAVQDTLLAISSLTDGKRLRVYSDRVEITYERSGGRKTRTPELLTYPNWTQPSRAFIDSSGVAWISSGSILVRYDESVQETSSYEASFPALLRRVTAIDSNTLLYGGAVRQDANESTKLIPDLHFHENALRFEFALPSYNDPTGNEYQYWLEGKDVGWSNWTKETSKNYTNLFEGTYRFHLRGRNAQGYVSAESVYTFEVLPPWYRSIWAYGLYALALVGLGLFARHHRRMIIENRKAKEQAKELAREREVNERLHDLNRRLEQANETLRQADRLKDEFLANTSHELRTPLTGILGCSSVLRDEVDDDQREFVEMIDENGQRLLNTLDSLLDLARLRAGLMEFDYRLIHLGEESERIAATYDAVARNKGIAVEVSVYGDVTGVFDDHCLDCILNHLIGNAVKFTDEGRVDVSIIEDGDQVVISVADTGVGIDQDFIPYLFDEFKQESTGLTRTHEGNGLGLAVTSRVVELLNGTIDVESEKGIGSTFIVRLPLERDESNLPAQGDGFTGTVELETADHESPSARIGP